MDIDDEHNNDNFICFDIGVLDLLDFGGPNLMRNGDQVYKASHLLELGVVSYGNKICKIEGICMQSSHPAETPHTLTIDTADTFNQWKFHCTCKAGNGGKCKHLYAALLHIHITKKLEVTTCTQRKQKWGKVSKEVAKSVLKPELISELSEMKTYQRYQYNVTQDERDTFSEILFSDPKSAVAVFLNRHYAAQASRDESLIGDACGLESGSKDIQEDIKELREFLETLHKQCDFGLKNFIFNSIPKNLLNFYNKRICMDSAELIKLSIMSRDQGNDLWRFERNLRITASECYKLFTAIANESTVWPSKIEAYYRIKPERKNLKIGRREEENAVKIYEKERKKHVTKMGLLVHPTCPWFGCSPDGFVFETNTLIEVKTLMNEKNLSFDEVLRSVAYLKYVEGGYVLREKHSHYAQVQMNMHFLRASKADLIIYNYKKKEIRIINIDYNAEFSLNLINSLKSVYFDHVLPYIFHNFTTETDKTKYE